MCEIENCQPYLCFLFPSYQFTAKHLHKIDNGLVITIKLNYSTYTLFVSAYKALHYRMGRFCIYNALKVSNLTSVFSAQTLVE